MKKIKIGILGANGKMGKSIEKLAHSLGCEISDRFTRETSIQQMNTAKCDIFIDVTFADATEKYVDYLLTKKRINRKPIVIGTTGHTASQLKKIKLLSKKCPILLAENFSVTVNLLFELIERTKMTFQKLNIKNYSAFVLDVHHQHKRDAPSGTAKKLCDKISPLPVDVYSVRKGNVIGTHELRIIGDEEILSFTHEALDRNLFSRGALVAAKWLYSKKNAPHPKLYTMSDVLN